MKRIHTSIALCSVLLLAACSGEEATQTEKEEVVQNEKAEQQGAIEKVKGTANDEAKEEEDIVWKTEPLTLTKAQASIYGTPETGEIELTGYTQDEEGKMIVVFGYSGDMKKADLTDKLFRIILDNGNTFDLSSTYLEEIRLIDDKEYHIYRSSTPNIGSIARVDMSLMEFTYNAFDEEENTVIKTKIEPSADTVALRGTQAFDVKVISPIERENSEMKMQITSVEPSSEEGLVISGEVTFKTDRAEAPFFSYLQPDMGIYKETELAMDTNTDTYYEGTTVAFHQKVTPGYPFAKDSVHTIYFTIGDEVFGVDVNTGEELDTIPATALFYKDSNRANLPIEGHEDGIGDRYYDTYVNEGYFGYVNNTDPGTDTEYIPTGGYDTLTFKVGAKAGNLEPHTYDMRIYADDFDVATQTGTVIYENEIGFIDPLRERTIDVSAYEKVYVLVDSKLANQQMKEKLFTYLYADAVLTR